MTLPFFRQLEKFVQKLYEHGGVRLAGWPLAVAGIVLFFLFYVIAPAATATSLALALFLAPLWLPLLVGFAAVKLGANLRHSLYIAAQDYVLLELKPPRALDKTPLAMESVLAGFSHKPGETSWWKKHVLGAVRPYWSFEIVSLEGQVHFYVWTRANFRKLVEAAFYAQYPGVQIVEAEDYTRTILAHSKDEWSAWGCEFKKANPEGDPYPIKTYVEYGLDKPQKEREQVDPLSNVVEFMSSVGKGEYLWLQCVIRVHQGEVYTGKHNEAGKPYTWRDHAKEIVEKIRKLTRSPYFDPITGREMPGFPNPTKGQSEAMAAIERNVGKLPFDVGIRAIYLARSEKFNPINITGIIGLFKGMSAENWNALAATRWFMEFQDYPWEYQVEARRRRHQRFLIDAYRRRQFFHEPYPMPLMTMSSEEIATLFHVPSASTPSPALPRIQSPTAEAPVNLPT